MKNKNKSIGVGFSKILWIIMAVLIFGSPCSALVVGTGETLDLDYAITGDFVEVYGTLNMYSGAYIDYGVYAYPGSTVNIYGGEIGDGFDICVLEGATANVQGEYVSHTPEDDNAHYDADLNALIIDDTLSGWGGTLTFILEGATEDSSLLFSALANIYFISSGPTNNPPVAVDDIAETMVNAPVTIDVLANDSDPDPNDTLAVDSVNTDGCNGSVEINEEDNNVTYTPDEDFIGEDTFEYTITDGQDTDTATVTVTVNCPANNPPIANAGPDQTVECQSPEGTQVTLDGTGSYDPDGDSLVSYTWTGSFLENPASGATPTVMLNDGCLGEHEISLVVNDGELASEPDTVTITVVDTTAPIISCPGNLEIELQGPEDGVPVEDERIQTFLAGASATDNYDPSPDIINDAPSIFPPGDTIVTFTATDASGNESTCQATVTVAEAAEARIRIIPKIINRNGFLHCVLAVIRFPVGVTKEDIDMDEPLMLFPGDSPDYIEATYQWAVSWYRWGRLHVCAYGFFPKDDIMAAVPENGLTDLMVVGRYADGQYYYGIDTVRIISWHWGH
jgi:hypothetical protein